MIIDSSLPESRQSALVRHAQTLVLPTVAPPVCPGIVLAHYQHHYHYHYHYP